MRGLIESRDYINLLINAHPTLEISHTRLEVPSFIGQLPISDTLANGLLKSGAQFLRPLAATLLQPKTLFIGLPFEPYDQSILVHRIRDSKKAIEIAKAQSLDLIVIPNVRLDENAKRLQSEGFSVLPSFPDMVLKLPYQSFAEYLASLSTSRRNSMRRNMKVFLERGYRVRSIAPKELNVEKAFEAYELFFRQAKVRWYQHTPDYFSSLSACNSIVRVWCAFDQYNTQVGFLIAFQDKDGLHPGRIGIAPHLHKKDRIYFNLIYALIQYAIEMKLPSVFLEPTSYQFKSTLGAKPVYLNHLVFGVSSTWRYLLANHLSLGHRLLSHLGDFEKLEGY